MIVFVGDIHGRFSHLISILENVPPEATIIQVGDFGYWPNMAHLWAFAWSKIDRPNPILFIDGNHEYHPDLKLLKEPTEVWSGLTYVPRGTVLEIDGKQIGFLGGAASVDRSFRTEGVSVFREEVITESDIKPLVSSDVPNLDILVTHTAPVEVINSHLGKLSLAQLNGWRLPHDWTDPSAEYVQMVWDHHSNDPFVVCGHFHRSLTLPNVRVLDIDEAYEFRSIGESYESY